MFIFGRLRSSHHELSFEDAGILVVDSLKLYEVSDRSPNQVPGSLEVSDSKPKAQDRLSNSSSSLIPSWLGY